VVPSDDYNPSNTVSIVPSAEISANEYIVSLRQEIATKEQFMQRANEELRSTTEEMQSI
jgi:hypothetical protein